MIINAVRIKNICIPDDVHPNQIWDAPQSSKLTKENDRLWLSSILGRRSAQCRFESLTHLAIFDVGLEADGSISNTIVGQCIGDHASGESSQRQGSPDSDRFVDSITGPLLSDPQKRAAAVATLADLVNSAGADGVNIDIEGLEPEYKDDLTAFVEEMAAVVDEVVVATPAIDWKGAYDYDKLANASDGLFIMGYGYHWSGGDPGPVDPLFGGSPWSNYSLEWTLDDYRTMGTPDDKIIMGLPLYGREWETVDNSIPGTATSEGVSVTMSAAMSMHNLKTLISIRSPKPIHLSPQSQLWYCDTDSVIERIEWKIKTLQVSDFGP